MAKQPLVQSRPIVEGMEVLSAGTLEAMRQEAIRSSSLVIPSGGYIILEEWFGILNATGKTPYSDERYWVKRAKITNAAGDEDSQLTVAALSDTDPRYKHVTATNLAELPDNTHDLDADTVVWVQKRRGLESPGVAHYFFSSKPPSLPAWSSFADTRVVHTGSSWANSPGITRDKTGAVTSEGRMYCAFAVGGDGKTVAQASYSPMSVYLDGVWWATLPDNDDTQVTQRLYIEWITSQYTPASLTWAGKPSTSEITHVLLVGIGDLTWQTYYDGCILVPSATRPANCHGVSVRITTGYDDDFNFSTNFDNGGSGCPLAKYMLHGA